MALDVVTVEYNIQIEKSKQALNDLEASYRKSDQAATQSANKVTEAYQKPAGILQKLQGQLKVLQDAQQKAFSPASVISLQRKIDETKGKIAALTGEINKSGGSMVNTFKNVAASVGLAFSVQHLINFSKELIGLALDAEEVKTAFKEMGNPQLLDQLRDAVSGTVDDVTLMKQALKAENLGIPVSKLASAFEFAERRAGALGLTTEEVIDTIIQGIGSKSTRAFTSLGIDALRVQNALKGLNAETASVADIMQAMGEIFTEELGKMGEAVDSSSDKIARMQAQWKDLKVEMGSTLISIILGVRDAFNDLRNTVSDTTESLLGNGTFLEGFARSILNVADPLGIFHRRLKDVKEFTEGTFSASGSWAEADKTIRTSIVTVSEMQKVLADLNKELIEGQLTQAKRNEIIAAAADLEGKIKERLGTTSTAVDKNAEAYKRWLEIQKEIAKEKERQGLILEPADAQIPSPEPAEKLADSLENLRVKLKTLQEQAEDGNLSAKLLEDKIAFEEMVRSMQQTANTLNAISNIYNGLNEIISEGSKQRLEDELELIERQKEAQLESLDKQLENEKLSAKQRESILKQRAALEEDFEKKTEQAREEAAKKQLKFTIAGIILNQSAAIASAIAGAVAQAAGNPIGIAAILAITLPLILSGMAQAMSAANAVELAEGEVGLKGPGSTKSDSIPARLSRGESVITAEGTNLDPDLLRAMNKGAAAFEEHIQHTYVWPYMEAMIKAHSKPEGRGMTFNDRNLLKELKTGNKLQIKTTQALIAALYRRENNRGKRN